MRKHISGKTVAVMVAIAFTAATIATLITVALFKLAPKEVTTTGVICGTDKGKGDTTYYELLGPGDTGTGRQQQWLWMSSHPPLQHAAYYQVRFNPETREILEAQKLHDDLGNGGCVNA